MTVELTQQQSDISEQNVLSTISVISQSTIGLPKQLSNDLPTTPSTNAKPAKDEQQSPLSNNDDKKLDTSSSLSGKNLSVICSTIPTTSASHSANTSDSISPSFSSHGEPSEPRNTLKRTREASCERPTNSESNVNADQPPAKRVSYSIMNILGKNKEKESTSEKKHQPYLQSTAPDISAFIQQQLSGASGINQFMMNPFLAAAAALSNQQNNSNQNQIPWLNMAAMSSLYGLEKGFSSNFNNKNDGLPSVEQLQSIQLQKLRSLNYSQSLNNHRTSSPNVESNNEHTNPTTQLQLQIGQMVNNLLQQQVQTEPDLSKSRESNEKQYQQPNTNPNNLLIKSEHSKWIKVESRTNVSDSSHSSSPLSLTPPLNQRYMIDNDIHHSFDDQQRQKLLVDNMRANTNKSFSNQDMKMLNNNGGASLDEDSENEDILEEDEDDIDGDSFDNGHRKKKTRTVFSRNQVFQLESTFDMKRYLSSSERSSLANSLQLTETQIKIWFQNRRNKWKRQLAAEIEANTSLSNGSQATTQHHIDSNRVPFPRNNIGVVSGPSNSLNQQSRISQHRLPTMYNPENNKSHFMNELEQTQNNLASSGSNSSLSSSSTRSSLSSPSQNLNNSFNNASSMLNNIVNGQSNGHFSPGSSMLTPQMLAAAAAASSLYYAATGTLPPNNQAFGQLAALNQASKNAKSLPGIL